MENESPNQDNNNESGFSAVKAYLLANKYDAALWLLRIYIVFSAFFYCLPLLGLAFSATCYKRILLGAATVYALRLHQRLPRFSLSREYLAQLFVEDSFHYLLFCLLFLTSGPATLIIAPVVLFAILHAVTFTRKIVMKLGSSSSIVQKLDVGLAKIQDRQSQQLILQLIASVEMFLMPATVLMLLTGQGSIMIPFFYYRFLQMRYTSQRNPYSRLIFRQTRLNIEHLASHPRCPQFGRNMLLGLVSFVLRFSPATVPATPAE